MDALIAALTSPSSGPFWGLLGIVATQVANVLMSRKKDAASIAASHLTAINDASKNLIESLFQSIKTQGEQITKLQGHSDECETQHLEARKQIADLTKQITNLQRVTGTPEGAV